jgi:ribonuclease-3
MPELDQLAKELDYRFGDGALLEESLTHRSSGTPNNERLEFLGDSILNFVIAAELFELEPCASEGELSRLRASLVRRETLAEIARSIDLGGYLRLGAGERKSGGSQRESTLANALEALIGAAFVDSDYQTCRRLILSLFASRLAERPDGAELRDPKTRLQEHLQARQLNIPDYRVLAETGAPHRREFKVECAVAALDIQGVGLGTSRRRAEQDAAAVVLARLAE